MEQKFRTERIRQVRIQIIYPTTPAIIFVMLSFPFLFKLVRCLPQRSPVAPFGWLFFLKQIFLALVSADPNHLL